MLCCSVPPTGPIDHFHSGSTLGGNPPPPLPPPPPHPASENTGSKNKAQQKIWVQGWLVLCSLCALAKGGGARTVWQGVCALRKHRLPATAAAAPKKIILCAVSGQHPSQTPKRCACTPPARATITTQVKKVHAIERSGSSSSW